MDSRAQDTGRGLPWGSHAVVFALALAVRLLHVFELRGSVWTAVLVGDGEGYDAWAQELAGGDWIGREVFYQTPLFPYLLGALYAALGRDLFAVRALQALLGATTCVLVGDASRRAFGRRAGLMAGLLLAVYAPAIHYEALIQKTALTLFELAWLTHTLARIAERPTRGRFLLAGALLGAIALTRETAIVLIPLVLAWILLGFRAAPFAVRARRAGMTVAGVLLLLLPVGVRNAALGGRLVLGTTNFGVGLWIGNGPAADGFYVPLRPGRGHTRAESIDAAELARAGSGRELSPAEVSDWWRDRTLEHVRSAPLNWARLMARKLGYLLHDREWMDSQSYLVFREDSRVLTLLGSVSRWALLLPLALAGMLAAWPRRRAVALWLAAPPVLALGIALFWVFGRFRMSLVPFVVPFAALGALAFFDSLRARDGRRFVALCVPAALGLALALRPLPPDLEYPLADTCNNFGSALLRAGEPERARVLYERARNAQPDYAAPWLDLGILDALEGDLAGARANLARAAELEPAYAVDGHLSLAELYQRRGDLSAARAELGRARKASPSKAQDFFRIGLLSRRLDDLATAENAYQRAVEMRPRWADALNNLAFLYQHTDREPLAVEHYRRALVADPGHTRALLNLARLRLGAADPTQRDTTQARALAERAAAVLGADHPDVRSLLEGTPP